MVHELGTLCIQRTIDTAGNPRGVAALSSDADSSLLVGPGGICFIFCPSSLCFIHRPQPSMRG